MQNGPPVVLRDDVSVRSVSKAQGDEIQILVDVMVQKRIGQLIGKRLVRGSVGIESESEDVFEHVDSSIGETVGHDRVVVLVLVQPEQIHDAGHLV